MSLTLVTIILMAITTYLTLLRNRNALGGQV